MNYVKILWSLSPTWIDLIKAGEKNLIMWCHAVLKLIIFWLLVWSRAATRRRGGMRCVETKHGFSDEKNAATDRKSVRSVQWNGNRWQTAPHVSSNVSHNDGDATNDDLVLSSMQCNENYCKKRNKRRWHFQKVPKKDNFYLFSVLIGSILVNVVIERMRCSFDGMHVVECALPIRLAASNSRFSLFAAK